MPNTPVQGLPYPALSDPANGPVALQNLATALEDYKTIVRCTSTTQPAHVEGRVIYETDTDRLAISDGAVWRTVNVQPTWTALPLLNSWATYAPGGQYGAPRYRKEGDRVYLSGMVTHASNASLRIATLPVGFRPIKDLLIPVATSFSNMMQVVYATADGGIQMNGVATTAMAWASLDSISFSTI